jgi:hypothetical protein
MFKKITMRRDPSCFCCLLVIGLLLLAGPSARGADLKVERVDGELALRHTIRLKMVNIPEWLSNSENKLSQLFLYVDGTAFKDPQPSLVQGDTLLFYLRRTEQNRDAWTTLLGRKGDSFFSRSVPVTVGFENGRQVPSAANSVTLIRVNEVWFQAFAVVVLLLFLLFYYLATKSDILRDTGPPPEKSRKTYSLARTQMAIWTLTVIIGYVFIWMVTSDLSSLTSGVLGLMGISAFTGLGSAVVDSNKDNEQIQQRREHEEKKKTAETEVEKLKGYISVLQDTINATPSPANLDEQKTTLAVKQAELAAQEKEITLRGVKIAALVQAAKPSVSVNFIKDLLHDDNGVSFHRFQISIWTIVLIAIFIGRVVDTLTMPTFDANLLALMGISGGTYIGFKLPDKQG